MFMGGKQNPVSGSAVSMQASREGGACSPPCLNQRSENGVTRTSGYKREEVTVAELHTVAYRPGTKQ
jgi:hypothetical protein